MGKSFFFGEMLDDRRRGSDHLSARRPRISVRHTELGDGMRVGYSKPVTYLDYPGHVVTQSSKFCRRCGSKQGRVITIIGPMDLAHCVDHDIKHPRISHLKKWWNVGPVRYMVAPPDYFDPKDWYIVREMAECPGCRERHLEKMYRRKFGRIRLFVMMLQSWLPHHPKHWISIELQPYPR